MSSVPTERNELPFLFAETAARRIMTFMRDAVPDRDGDLYVPRRTPMNSADPSHPTSGTPPGTPPILDQPQAA